MFLTDDELFDLTGYRRNADRCRWLKSHGFKFEVSGIGRPIVLRSHLESRLSEPSAETERVWTPNLAAMKKVA